MLFCWLSANAQTRLRSLSTPNVRAKLAELYREAATRTGRLSKLRPSTMIASTPVLIQTRASLRHDPH